MKSEFQAAINQLASDRNLPREVIVDAIRSALVSAYKRDFGGSPNLVATLDPNTGNARIFAEKQAVELVEDDTLQMPLEEARQIDPEAVVGSIVRMDITPKNFGRIAAQTAKQVILQRIREAKRDHLYTNYAEREGELIIGIIQGMSPKGVTLALGDEAEAVLPDDEQIKGEFYRREQRVRVYIYKVERSTKGPQIFVSRRHKKMLLRLLELEVPEIANGVVEVRAIAREPGQRSKVAVSARQPGIDPVGSCVGMRGGRIQHIVDELNGEKIDIVPWSPEVAQFIANALSPAKVVSVTLGEGKTATVIVPDKQLSLAIGKEGQNARLAAKLTGWRIDIVNQTDAAERTLRMMEDQATRAAQERERSTVEEEQRQAAAALLAEAEATLVGDEDLVHAVGTEATTLEGERAIFDLDSVAPMTIEEPPLSQVADISFDEIDLSVVPTAAAEEEETPANTKGKKKVKKGKREIVLEQRQAAAKKRKQPVARRADGSVEEDLDWQHLRNVDAEEILAEEEVPVDIVDLTDVDVTDEDVPEVVAEAIEGEE